MKALYIFDLDGTLADIEHRTHIIQSRQQKKTKKFAFLKYLFKPKNKLPNNYSEAWKEFNRCCVNDLPNNSVIATLDKLKATGADIWIWSGRSCEVRSETISWLITHTSLCADDFNDQSLIMRKENDYTPDNVLKRQWFELMLPADRKRLIAVFDDRDRVVEMWREAGVTCFQVAQGNF